MIKTVLFLMAIVVSSCTQTCASQNYFVNPAPIQVAINQYFSTVLPSNPLQTLITSPTITNLMNYAKSIAPIAVPALAMAVITFIGFIVCILQLTCWNCCNVKACGKQINRSTYTARSVKCFVAFTIIFSLVILALCSFGMFVNHDLILASQITSCTGFNFFDSIINGSSSQNNNWTGISNLNSVAQQMETSFQNNIGSIYTYFNTTANSLLVSLESGGALNTNVSSSLSNCTNPVQNISCPDGSVNCTATFASQFCNASYTNSAMYNITAEKTSKVDSWASNLQSMFNNITSMYVNMSTVVSDMNSIISGFSTFTTNSNDYSNMAKNAGRIVNNSVYYSQIAIYVFYSFIILVGLLTIVATVGIFYCRCYRMKCCLKIFWIVYSVFGICIFIISGAQYLLSIAAVQGCGSYTYVTQSQSHFNSVFGSFNNQILSGIENCYFGIGTFTQAVFSSAQISEFTVFGTYVNSSMPPSNFSTVQTSVYNNLQGYSMNPQVVMLDGSVNQPQAVYNTFNMFTNYSATGSTQGCNCLKDYMVFNTLNCGMYPLENGTLNAGNNSCVSLFNTTTTTARGNNMTTNGSIYTTNATNLNAYGTGIQSQVTTITSSNSLITQYPGAYYNYYAGLQQLMNPSVVAQISSFMVPLNSLYTGLSCSYITTTTSDFVGKICNEFTPILYMFSSVNIGVASLLTMLMILTYFLIPRMEFFEHLQGDLDNIEQILAEKSIQMQGKQQILETNTYRNY